MCARLTAWGSIDEVCEDRPGSGRGGVVFASGGGRPQLHLPRQWRQFSDRRDCLHPRPAVTMPDEPEQSVMAADQRNLSAGARKAPRGALRVAVLAIGSAAILLLAQLNGTPAGARGRSGVFDYY